MSNIYQIGIGIILFIAVLVVVGAYYFRHDLKKHDLNRGADDSYSGE